MNITTKEIKALKVLCDAYFFISNEEKDDYNKRLPSDLKVHEKIIALIDDLSLVDQKKIKTLLRLINSPLIGLTANTPFKSITKYTPEQLQKLINSWGNSRIESLRIANGLIKKLSAFYFYANNQNPNWDAIGYGGPLAASMPQINALNILENNENDLECDVVIVGSGVGGSIVAEQLALDGKTVIVVEKGKYIRSENCNQNEADMMATLYDTQGLLANKRGDFSLLAGSSVGGGSTVNWAGCFRTPDYVLKEWEDAGNAHFGNTAYHQGFEYIEQKLNIHTEISKHNPQNQALWDGAKKLGLHPEIIARNTKQEAGVDDDLFWRGQGYSSFGDAFHTKKGTNHTLLSDAQQAGCRIISEATAKKVIIKNGQAIGIIVSQHGNTFKIRAKQVVVSAGALHTPVLLKKSGITHSQIGKNLHLHPSSFALGFYKNEVKSWEGPMMSTVVNDYAKLNGNFGYKLETAPFHLGVLGVALPRISSLVFKNMMRKAVHLAVFIVLVRDKFGGSIDVDATGKPIITYNIHKHDKAHLLHGLQKGLEVHKAAGAEEFLLGHSKTPILNQSSPTFAVSQLPWKTGQYSLGSAHQMGTCRMGGNSKTHPTKPSGELWSTKNLWVADASLFPNASGVNPMVSIYALSYHVAQELKTRM